MVRIQNRIALYTRLYKSFKKEERLHIESATFLFENYPKALWFHPPNEGKRRDWFEQVKLGLMGVRKGVPDFIVLEPNNQYNGLIIEAKMKYTYLSKAQKQWKERLLERNYHFAEFRSINEFKEIVTEYFKTVPFEKYL